MSSNLISILILVVFVSTTLAQFGFGGPMMGGPMMGGPMMGGYGRPYGGYGGYGRPYGGYGYRPGFGGWGK
ncbi:unnamed protein product [Caenorhabditis angaria]|uniref:Uncharacterized protein n=1 Tax=Caenorhabditis angaria TaxID=860376 RepID=A0A9P1N874_9PELO|nr:unnamed protein product [Caenorhabditis angaria]